MVNKPLVCIYNLFILDRQRDAVQRFRVGGKIDITMIDIIIDIIMIDIIDITMDMQYKTFFNLYHRDRVPPKL